MSGCQKADDLHPINEKSHCLCDAISLLKAFVKRKPRLAVSGKVLMQRSCNCLSLVIL